MSLINLWLFLTIISVSFQCELCHKHVEGHLSDSLWFKFDMKLWTFRVNSNDGISIDNAEISAARSESVKGLNFINNKNVKFPPIKVHEKFPHLVAYQIFNCSLKEVRYKHFEQLKELQAVYLGYNQLTHIPVDIFKDQNKLKFLSLQGNHLQSIDEKTFENLGFLRELFLNHNQIHSLPNKIFENLTELRNISISDNKIESLTDEHFINNNKLEKIFMHSNNIKKLSPTMFDHMTHLVVVHFKGNICINEDFYADLENCNERFPSLKEKIINNCFDNK